MILVPLALMLNICVLIPVVGSILAGAQWTAEAYGAPTPGLQILTAIYIAILLMSIYLLVAPNNEMTKAFVHASGLLTKF